MLSFCWLLFISIFDDFVGKLAVYFSSFKTENSHSRFANKPLRYKHKKKNLASGTE